MQKLDEKSFEFEKIIEKQNQHSSKHNLKSVHNVYMCVLGE